MIYRQITAIIILLAGMVIVPQVAPSLGMAILGAIALGLVVTAILTLGVKLEPTK